MLDLTLAPCCGRVLAYGRDQLVYDSYTLQNGAIVLNSGVSLDLAGVHELHLFDTVCEYRAICKQGEWAVRLMQEQDEVEDEDHFVFSESQFVKERFWVGESQERIVVNNRFSFTEDGFLRLTGYRLAMEAAE